MVYSDSEIHVDAPLSKVSVMYSNKKYIGTELMPIIRVKQDTGTFFTYNEDSLRDFDDQIGNGGISNEVTYGLGSETYTCYERGGHVIVSKKDLRNQTKPLNLLEDSTIMLTDQILVKLENRIATKCTTTANYNASNYATISTKWDSYATSDPETDLETGFKAVQDRTGFMPNVLVIGYEVWQKLKYHPAMKEYFKYVRAGSIKPEDMKVIFPNIERVYIANARYVSSDEGQSTITRAYLWGKNVVAAYVPPRPGLRQPAFGYTLVSVNRSVQRKYEWKPRAYWIEIRMCYGLEWIVRDASDLAQAGYLYALAVS